MRNFKEGGEYIIVKTRVPYSKTTYGRYVRIIDSKCSRVLSLNVNAQKLISEAKRVCISCNDSKHLVYVLPSNDNCSYSVVRSNSNCNICVYGLVNEFNIKTKVLYEAIPYKDGFCFTYEENNIE